MNEADAGIVSSLLGIGRGESDTELASLFRKGLGVGLSRLSAHGDFPRFLEVTKSLPAPTAPGTFDRPAPRAALRDFEEDTAIAAIEKLAPFRKGPFLLGKRLLDAEWRSDAKWERLEKLASPFEGRRVLDVGCGNGYYLFRLEGKGVARAVGVEPSVLYTSQFLALQRLLRAERVAFLPATLEELGAGAPLFDTVLSMGVLYHRKDPTAHISDLSRHLRPGGELVIETLIVSTGEDASLVPPDRYAMMRNVHVLPSPKRLVRWLEEAGFRDIELGPEVPTTVDEQRSTPFMKGPSLVDFLDPNDETSTIEGLPAPIRLMARAKKF